MSYEFPLFKTKSSNHKKFNLDDPKDRQKYFNYKVGKEIKKIKKFLEKNTFVAFLLGKKNSGKGTYSKLFMEAIGNNRVAHISVGDIVRSVHKDLSIPSKHKELISFLKKRYRGFISIEKALDIILGRDTKSLLPTEIILALVEREIDRLKGKAIFIDGFPRNLDQVSYSLYFRALMGYRYDPDFFVFINVPDKIIDERMKYRVICPNCYTPRNLRLLRTKTVKYDKSKKEFYLLCDNADCRQQRMISKEGDELGIEAIRDRIEVDDKVMRTLFELYGVPKIFLRNSVPVSLANKYVDQYEITPAYYYSWEAKSEKVKIQEKPWVVKDDKGIKSYSLFPTPITVALIKQIATVLNL